MKLFFITLVYFLGMNLQPLFSEVYDEMSSAKICVAYKTTKGMLYVSKVDVIGINCDVRIEKQTRKIRVLIPVEKFDSGHFKRDSEVAFLLGGSEKTPLEFELNLLKDPSPSSVPEKVTGRLWINKSPKDVTLQLSKTSDAIRFVVPTKFSELGVRVDPVGPGGLIAKPQDELVLYGQIPNVLLFKTEK